MLWPIDRHHVVRRQYQHGQLYTGKRYEAQPWLCDHVCGSSRLLRCRNGNLGNAQIESPRERLCFVSGIDRPRASLILLRGSWHQNAPSRPDSAGDQPPSLVLSDLEMQMADTVALSAPSSQRFDAQVAKHGGLPQSSHGTWAFLPAWFPWTSRLAWVPTTQTRPSPHPRNETTA